MDGASATLRVNVWVAFAPTPFAATMDNEYTPPLPAAGVPDRVAVPSPLSWNVTPAGGVTDSERVGAGNPVAVTVKLPADPTVKVAVPALVIAGAWSTVSVNVCVAAEPTPFAAVMVKEYVPPVPGSGVPASVA